MHLCVCACVYVIVCVHYALFYHSLWACACRDFQMLNKVINFSIVLMAVPLGVRTQRAVLCNTSFLRTGALAHQLAFFQWCHSAATDVSCKNPSARGELWCMVRFGISTHWILGISHWIRASLVELITPLGPWTRAALQKDKAMDRAWDSQFHLSSSR